MALLTIARRGSRHLPDPFRALQLQIRLSRLSGEVGALERAERGAFAIAFHLQATILAYEQTLQEACWLAEIPVTVDGPVGRLMAEATLQRAGWSW